MQIKFNILTIFTLLAGIASGQIDLEKEELKLNEELLNFRTEFTAAGMDKANISFASKMKDFLLLDGAYTYTFKHLETVAILDSPDGKIRIVNWNIEYPDFSYSFGGFVLHKNNKKVSIFELKDAFDPYQSKPNGIVNETNWYGALYYKIIPFLNGRNTEYLLLGWDGGTTGSNYKILDVLSVAKKHIYFGSPVFNTNGDLSKRIVFEYSDRANMTMRYEEKYGRIVMDHLSPEAPSMEGVYSYYVPDFSYDAYIFDGRFWKLKEDIIAVNNPQEANNEFIQLNPRTGRLEKKRFKKDWINPTNSGVKGEIEHVARIPETPLANPPVEKDEKRKKKRTKKYDPSGLSVTTGKYKKRRKNH